MGVSVNNFTYNISNSYIKSSMDVGIKTLKFRDKYPRRCNQLCPACKKECMHSVATHINEEGCFCVHVCGPHWWIEVAAPDGVKVLVSGVVKNA